MARRDAGPDSKEAALAETRCLNPHPEQVRDPAFGSSDFFDARDLVQVKYEMVRRVKADGAPVTATAAAFGYSRPSYYQAAAALERSGLEGLVPARPGPRSGHKLTGQILAWSVSYPVLPCVISTFIGAMTIRLRIVQPPMLIGWKSSGYAGLPPARPAETAARVLDSGPPSPLLSLPSGSEAPIRSSSIMSESFRSGGALVAAPRQPRHGPTTLFTSSRGLGPSLAGLSPRETSAAGRRVGEVKVINQGGKASGRGLRPEPLPHGHLGRRDVCPPALTYKASIHRAIAVDRFSGPIPARGVLRGESGAPASCRSPVLRLVRGSWAGVGSGVAVGGRGCGPVGAGQAALAGAAGRGEQVLPFVLAMPALGQI